MLAHRLGYHANFPHLRRTSEPFDNLI
jgi:hypothetical protein